MSRSVNRLSGWGYEGSTPEELQRHIALHEVKYVVDVRLNAVSRRKGFSKKALEQTVVASGAKYIHLPALGNPKENRAGFYSRIDSEYEAAVAHFREKVLTEDQAHQALNDVVDLLREGAVMLLCFEKSASCCQRTPVIEVITSILVQRT
jgi:uncharacterized protein (DUF488 family)